MLMRRISYCVALLLTCTTSARDIKTTTGETYRNITINRIEPTGISITHSTGVAFLECPILPEEIRREAGCSFEAYAAGKIARQEQDKAWAEYRARVEIEAAQRNAERNKQIAAAMDAAELRRIARETLASPIATRDYASVSFESSSLAADRYSGRNYAPTGGTVSVRGYMRKDGTYVRPHTRSAPRRR